MERFRSKYIPALLATIEMVTSESRDLKTLLLFEISHEVFNLPLEKTGVGILDVSRLE